jgi:hypothetical protein
MSESSIQKMIFFNEHLSSDRIKNIHLDLLELIRISSIQYSRNIYKKNAYWNSVRSDWEFDYNYVQKHNSTSEFEFIRKQLNTYAHMFIEKRTKYKRDFICKNISVANILLYENFVEESLKKMLNNIIILISCPLTNLIIIKKKYEHLVIPIPKYKSKKINYEVLNQLLKT